LEDSVEIVSVDTDCDTHEHVLRSFGDLSIDAKEVRALESFESEVVLRVFGMGSVSMLSDVVNLDRILT
jgi:hypothetical protein